MVQRTFQHPAFVEEVDSLNEHRIVNGEADLAVCNPVHVLLEATQLAQ